MKMKGKKWLLAFALLFSIVFSGYAADFLDYSITPSSGFGWDDLSRVRSSADKNGNGISDTDDLVAGARAYVETKPLYRSAYHRGGYPPAGEGVCTDVIWAALQHAGYDLKEHLNADIRTNRQAYPRVTVPDSNIDFRRVPNLISYFKRHGKSLSTTIKPGDRENLIIWQPGNIVTFSNPDHIAILSDKRNSDGVPYLLHNQGPWASEGDDFMYWYERGITGHFRYPPN